VLTGELNKFAGLGQHHAALRRARDVDAPAATKLKQALVAQ
jgi:hypothetical protein